MVRYKREILSYILCASFSFFNPISASKYGQLISAIFSFPVLIGLSSSLEEPQSQIFIR